MAADLIEIMTGLGSEDYDLALKVQLPSAVQDHLARAEVLRAEADRKKWQCRTVQGCGPIVMIVMSPSPGP
jgi:hypothetical protein